MQTNKVISVKLLWSPKAAPASVCQEETPPKPSQYISHEHTWEIAVMDSPFLQLRVVAPVVFGGLHDNVPLGEGPKAIGDLRGLG